MGEIKNEFIRLKKLPKHLAAQRGREFEKLIHLLLDKEKLDPKRNYRPKGEEIDASFLWHGQVFLLEAKWTRNPIPASSIYSFKGKIDGKFHTTSGVFFSMSGYSNDASDALRFGNVLNIILFGKSDLELIFEEKHTFSEILEYKLRQAGDIGDPHVPFKLPLKPTGSVIPPRTPLVGDPSIKRSNYLVFIEGRNDLERVEIALTPLSKESYSFEFIMLSGANNVRYIPTYLRDLSEGDYLGILIILDEDVLGFIPDIHRIVSQQFQDLNLSVPVHIQLISDQEILAKSFTRNIGKFIRSSSWESLSWEDDIFYSTIDALTDRMEWDYDSNEVVIDIDTLDYDNAIAKSPEELVQILEQEIIKAINGELPLEYLKEKDYYDYETEVWEYLESNYEDELDKMKWINH